METEIQSAVATCPTVMSVVQKLPIPNYPYDIEVKIALTEELELEIRKELDEVRRGQMLTNIIINMITASLTAIMEPPKKESGLIIP